jgi:hypothetical protein
MDRDELRDRLLRAADADPAAVDRVVTAALASGQGGMGSRVFAALATCFVAVVVLGVWWSTRQPAAPADGIYRVEALEAINPEGMDVVSSTAAAASDGVYRTTANLSLAPSRVIRVRTDDGTTWILSTDALDDWPPPGSRVIVGGGEVR